MLGIQNRPNVAVSKVAFKGDISDLKYDLEAERDQKVDEYTKAQSDWNEFADTLENSDNKVMKKTGKLARVAASVFGLAVTYAGAKYGSKFAIESVKTLANNKTSQSIVESVKKLKRPALKAMVYARRGVRNIMNNPSVQNTVNKVAESGLGKKVAEFAKNENVVKVMEPIKKTIASMKDVKIDGKKIQNFVENTMAITTTGSVLVDDLAGRNNNKSAAELATGV